MEEFKNGNLEKIVVDFRSVSLETITVDKTGITIDKKGILNALTVGVTGAKKIPYTSITTVHFKESGILSGHLQFSVMGATTANSGMLSAASDKFAILFAIQEEEDIAMKIRDIVDEKISSASLGGTTVINQKSPAEQVKEMKELLGL